jgi:FMN phosphatase YigB (HAD superfamily)
LKEVKVIISDVDGTLVSSRKISHFFLRLVSRISFLRFFYLRVIVRNGKRFSLEKLVAKIIFFFSEQLEKNEKKPELSKGAKKFLKKARDRGVKVFASSNSKSERIERFFKGAHINNLFDNVFGREIPKRDHIKKIFDSLDNKLSREELRKRTLVIGNELGDIILSREEGINNIVMITNPFSKKELMDWGVPEENIFRDFDEINKKIFCQ